MAQKSKEELFNELKQRAEQGNKEAQFIVGEKYWCDGKNSDAMYFLRKAAKQNHAEAQLLLAKVLYDQGCDDEARHWVCCAHLNGNTEAANLMNKIIELYEGISESSGERHYYKFQEHIALVQKLGINYDYVMQEKDKQNKRVLCIVAVSIAIGLYVLCAIIGII